MCSSGEISQMWKLQGGMPAQHPQAEPLQSSHAGQTRRYHAVLMVRHFKIYWRLQCCEAVLAQTPGRIDLHEPKPIPIQA